MTTMTQYTKWGLVASILLLVMLTASDLGWLQSIGLSITGKETGQSQGTYIVRLVMAGLAIGYFAYTVAMAPLFPGNSTVTAKETLARLGISTALNVLTFAVLFTGGGMNLGDAADTAGTALYFSIVTFSTLGYGDISPADYYRLPAAALAFIGNLHLGLLAALCFHLFQRDRGTVEQRERTARIAKAKRERDLRSVRSKITGGDEKRDEQDR